MHLHAVNSIAVLKPPEGAESPRLTRAVLGSLRQHLQQIQGAGVYEGLVIMANEKSFFTGAEIGEVAKLQGADAWKFALRGQELCNQIDTFPIPVVAAIRGFCLGGGLDLALACHARVATFESSFGHPGGVLGLITGWGGTQRLPRLIGKAQGLQMLLTGERVPATQALTLGLVNELVATQDLTEAAVRFCERMVRTKAGQEP